MKKLRLFVTTLAAACLALVTIFSGASASSPQTKNFPMVGDFALQRSFAQPCADIALTAQQMMHREATRTDNWQQKFPGDLCVLTYRDWQKPESRIKDEAQKDEVIDDFSSGEDYTAVAFGDRPFNSNEGMQIRWFDSVDGWFVKAEAPCINWKDIKVYIRSQDGTPPYWAGKFTRPEATFGVLFYKGPGRRFVIPRGMATIDTHSVVRLAGYVMPKSVTKYVIFNRFNFNFFLLRRGSPVMNPWS